MTPSALYANRRHPVAASHSANSARRRTSGLGSEPRSILTLAILLSTLGGPSLPTARGQVSVLADGATPVRVLSEGAGEGPAWDPELGLLFSGHGNIQTMDAAGELAVYREKAGSNGLLFDHQGRLLVCQPAYRRVSRIDRNGKLTVLTDKYNRAAYNQPNDITVDSRGRIFFSDPKYGERTNLDQRDSKGRAIEGVYRIDQDHRVTRIITHEVDRPNGLVVTPDDRFLYVADNNNNEAGGSRKLWRFEFDSNGELKLESQKLIYDWKDSRGPDGMVLDRRGRLYVAGGRNKANRWETRAEPGGVYVFSPAGELLTLIRIPNDEVTNCAFGGADLKTLYITAGGNLWSVRTAVAGQLPWPKSP